MGRVSPPDGWTALDSRLTGWGMGQDWIPAFGENDGGEGKDHSRCRVRVFLFPSLPCAFFPFAVILVASTGIQSWTALHFLKTSSAFPPSSSPC